MSCPNYGQRNFDGLYKVNCEPSKWVSTSKSISDTHAHIHLLKNMMTMFSLKPFLVCILYMFCVLGTCWETHSNRAPQKTTSSSRTYTSNTLYRMSGSRCNCAAVKKVGKKSKSTGGQQKVLWSEPMGCLIKTSNFRPPLGSFGWHFRFVCFGTFCRDHELEVLVSKF